MVENSAKRRKLEHTNSDESEDMGNEEPEQESEESDEEKSDEDFQSKDFQSKPKGSASRKDISKVNLEAVHAGGLYRSAVFKLQIDDLLAEVRPNYEKYSGILNEKLHDVKALIEGIPDREPLTVLEATELMQKTHKIAIPYPDPKPNRNALYKLSYTRPSRINVTGSYVLKTMVKSKSTLAVDMVVTMPECVLQEKDYLNYRYLYKRAYYLSCIAAGLQHRKGFKKSLHFEFLNGNSLQPILVLKCDTDDTISKKFHIQIIPAAPEAFFNETKLYPHKNAIRLKDESSRLVATPFYNATVQSDVSVSKYLRLLDQASQHAVGFQDACILGRIWLRQRGFSSRISQGGFGHFEWASMSALLLLGGGPKGHSVLSPGYSSYQIFKAVIQYLATRDLIAHPVVYQGPDIHSDQKENPMFYDGPRGMNILFKMSACSYALLREEAKTSLEMLNDAVFDQFNSTFIVKADHPVQKFDRSVQVALPSNDDRTGDHEDVIRRMSDKLYKILKRSLTDRVRVIEVKTPDVSHWSLKTTYHSSPNTLLVGFVVDPGQVDRLIDRGPTAEEDEAAGRPFQRWWLDKTELRRTAEGIRETLTWPKSNVSSFQQLIAYILSLHLGIDPSTDLTFYEQEYTQLLPSSGKITSQDATNTLRGKAFQDFEKDISRLDKLPLSLRQLSPVDSQFRNTSLNPPIFNSNCYLQKPAEIIIQFEGSARWPDDVIAIQRTKIAFLLKIAELFAESDLSARVGLENSPSTGQSNEFLNVAFLDVYYPSGAAFRLRIQNEREQILLERLVADKSTESKIVEKARSALAVYKRDFVQLPWFTQAVSTNCTRFPALSSSIRLTKQWFAAHLLSSHVSEPLIELLVIRTFLQPYPWQPPSSAMTGFVRTLKWLAKWDWHSQPLIVDFSGNMTELAVKNLETKLEAWRKIDPSMNYTVLFAATDHDESGIAFTHHGPSIVATKRMIALARSATKLVEGKGLDLDIQTLFRSTTAEYDFVISFKKAFASERSDQRTSTQQFKNLAVQEALDTETIGFDPQRSYIQELQELYSDSVVLFHGGGDFVAGLWNPAMKRPRKFLVNGGFAAKPCPMDDDVEQDRVKVVLDREAILAEMTRLGGDMIKAVKVRTS